MQKTLQDNGIDSNHAFYHPCTERLYLLCKSFLKVKLFKNFPATFYNRPTLTYCVFFFTAQLMPRLVINQSRSQSIRYFCPADGATNALEESKTGTTKSWFRFNCACVKLFTHLTKRRSQMQGKFSLQAHCCNFLFPKQFLFCDL